MIRESLRVEVLRDICDVDQALWDACLKKEDVLMSRDFVLACQRSCMEDAEYWHLLVWDGSVLAGVATVHRMYVHLDLLTVGSLKIAARIAKKWLPNVFRLPVLICGLPISIGKSCCRVLPNADASRVIQAIAMTMEQIAQSQGYPLICFKEFSDASLTVMDTLLEAKYFRAASLPTCELELRWTSMTSYMNAMRAGYRRQIKQSIQAGESAGLRIRVHEKPEDHIGSFYPLYIKTLERAAHRLETANGTFFCQLAEKLGGRLTLVTVERGGKCLAAALLVISGKQAQFLFVGMDYERIDQKWQVYPNLLLAMVEESMRNGAEYLEFGQTSYASKGRLGGEPRNAFLYFRHRRPSIHFLMRICRRFLFPDTSVPTQRVFKQASPHFTSPEVSTESATTSSSITIE